MSDMTLIYHLMHPGGDSMPGTVIGFANSRQALLAAHMDCEGKSGIDAFTVGAPTTIKSMDIWKLTPTNQGFMEAQSNTIWEPRLS